MTHGSLFSGVGGFDLAAEWAGFENVFHCEWNEFGQKVLNYYWPHAESFTDITKTDFRKYANKIDILTGGFPCQGFSIAGLRKGTEDHRFLWPEMRRAYQESKPTWVMCENVTGLLTMEDKREVSKDVFFKVENSQVVRLQEVDLYNAIYIRQAKMLIESICQDFEKDGYEVQPFIIPSASIEAPHKRDRVWIIAYSGGPGRREDSKGRLDKSRELLQRQERKENSNKSISGEQSKSTADTGSKQLQERTSKRDRQNKEKEGSGMDNRIERSSDIGDVADTNQLNGDPTGLYSSEISQLETPEIRRNIITDTKGKRIQRSGTNQQQKSQIQIEKRVFGRNYSRASWKNFPTQSPVCSGDDGISDRLAGITFSKHRAESIKAYGNSVSPDIPYEFFKAINQTFIK